MAGAIVCALLLSSCYDTEQQQSDSFYSATKPQARREFRWSNGKAPKTLDPAAASAPPETDVVRAIYEGLTDLDPKSLDAIPAVAESWDNSADFRTWTFHLRKDAKWSNGESVTAGDFVRSWKRLVPTDDAAARNSIVDNIVGTKPRIKDEQPTEIQKQTANASADFHPPEPPPLPWTKSAKADVQKTEVNPQAPPANTSESPNPKDTKKQREVFGVLAKDDRTLEVKLVTGDPEFPKLVAHPMFRPIYEDGSEFSDGRAATEIVTNGSYRISDMANGLLLEKSDTYWNKNAVKLEKLRFVPKDSASDALESYRAGDLDVVTNAEFEPLALKLLAPYGDFRRATHAAINLYEFNDQKAPFNDRRVRQALSLAIERERLAEGEMEGSVRPAMRFLPFGGSPGAAISPDIDEAQNQLEDAGYPDGKGFPTVRLIVNRNDTQLRIAKLVARMWKDNLNISTTVIVKESGEIESVRKSGDFDLIRRGVVFPTSDSEANLRSLFEVPTTEETALAEREFERVRNSAFRQAETNSSPADNSSKTRKPPVEPSPAESPQRFTEEDALYDMRAIPLYFPTSYSLVKPYVQGFDINGLDSPSLRNVTIDNDWQP